MTVRKARGRRVLGLLGLAFAGAAGSGWRSVGPAGGGWVSPVFVSGPYVFASDLHGVWRSADRGSTWACIQPRVNADFFMEAGSRLYEVAHPKLQSTPMVLESRDHGATWISRLDGSDSIARKAWRSLPFSASIGRYWVVAGDDGIYRSRDSGAAWERIEASVPWKRGPSVRLIRQGSVLIAINESGCFASLDSGATWAKRSDGPRPGLPIPVLALGRFLVGFESDTAYRSPDTGRTWQRLPAPSVLHPVLAQGGDLYAVANGERGSLLMRSSDSGGAWAEVGPIVAQAFMVTSLAFAGDTVFAGTVSSGVLRSSDGGAHFERTPLPGQVVNAMAADERGLWAGTSSGDRLYRFDADAEAWVSPWASRSERRSVGSVAVEGGTVFAAEYCCATHLSRNGGADWIRPPAAGIDSEETYAAAAKDGALLLAARKCVYRLPGNASRWECAQPLPRPAYGDDPTLFSAPGAVFLGDSAGVFRSRDGGAHWEAVNQGLEGEVHLLAGGGGALYAGGPKGLFRSDDQGDSWTRLVPGPARIQALAAAGQALFAGRDSGVYVSFDAGKSWTAANEGLSGASITSLAIVGQDLYAGTGGSSVWKRPLAEFGPGTGIRPGSAAVRRAGLHLIRTDRGPVFAFAVPAAGPVHLDVYDHSGRRVGGATDRVPGQGPVQLSLAGRALPAGAYLVRLRAVGLEATAAMALLP